MKKEGRCFPRDRFYGAAVVGERGQIVIPKDARAYLGLKRGDRLVVLGKGPGLFLLKADELKAFAESVLKGV